MIIAVSFMILITGCEGTVSKPSEGFKQELGRVDLKILIPGDRPLDMDKVLAEAEKRMAHSINVKLEIIFVPWADLNRKTKIQLASGENLDLIFDAPWLHIDSMIDAGYYTELDELLKQYGQNIVKSRPQQMWDYNKFRDKIMGIPLGNAFYQGATYFIRKDIREKLGIAPVKTYDELIKFAYVVKEKESTLIPFLPNGNASQKDLAQGAYRKTWDVNYTNNPVNNATSMLYRKGNDTKIYNMFEEKDPIIWSWILDARKLYMDKIIYQDVLTVKDPVEQFKAGKTAIIAHYDFGVPSEVQSSLKQNIPGAEAEAVTFIKMTPKAYRANFKMWNFICVAKVSKHKERAIMFLDWANQKENYDLLAYGIQGTHWEPKGENEYVPKASTYSWFPFAWIWNPKLDRLDISQGEETIKQNKFLRIADNFETDKLAGFNIDIGADMNEWIQYQAIEDKYYSALFNGVLDPETTFEKFKAEAAPLLKKVQEEAQKQVDEFLDKK